jgi:putative transposase
MSDVIDLVSQELLLRNEYLAAENRILKAHSPRNLRLSDGERSTLAEIGKRRHMAVLAATARISHDHPRP